MPMKMSQKQIEKELRNHADASIDAISKILSAAEDDDEMAKICLGAMLEVLSRFYSLLPNKESTTKKVIMRCLQNAMFQVANDIHNFLEEAKNEGK